MPILQIFLLRRYEGAELRVIADGIKVGLRAGRFQDVFFVQCGSLFQIDYGVFGVALIAVYGRYAVIAPRIVRVSCQYLLKIGYGFVVLAVDFIRQG